MVKADTVLYTAKYNNSGKLIELIQRDGPKRFFKFNYVYNPKGQLITIVESSLSNSGTFSPTVLTTFIYDKKGNWIEQRIKSLYHEKFANIISRKIEYYD